MNDLANKFNVFLRSDVAESTLAFLRIYAESLEWANGSRHLCLSCSDVVADHPVYLQARLSGGRIVLRIPHHFVIAVVESNEERTPFGFVAQAKSGP